MTFLSDTRIESPVTKTVKYKGKEGIFVFWDSDKKEEFEITIDRFIPLAVRTMVTGYSKQAQKGIWSNEVNAMDETLEVTIGGNLEVSGTWKEIKYEMKAKGGKFTPVVYAVWDGEIIRLLFAGACCGPWIEISKEARRSEKPGVVIAGFTDEVSGEVHFKAPVFRLNAVLPETLEKAVKLKEELDQFFLDYARAKAVKSTDRELNQERHMDEMNQEHEHDEHFQSDPEEVNAELQEIAATESTEKNHQAYQDVDGDEVPF